MSKVIRLSDIRSRSGHDYSRAGNVRWNQGGKVSVLRGQSLEKQLENEVKGGVTHSLLKEIIRKRIADFNKRKLVGNIVFNDELKKANPPTKDQIARLHKRLKRHSINPESHLEAINKLLPKDKPLTYEGIREIVDEVERTRNRNRYMSKIARDEQDYRESGMNKVRALTSTDAGFKVTGKQRLGTKEERQDDVVVSIADRMKQKKVSSSGQNQAHSTSASSPAGAVGVASAFGTQKSKPDRKNALEGNFGREPGLGAGVPPIGFKKAA